MDDARLGTEFWIKAHIRRLDREAVPVVVVRRGDPMAGTVLVRVAMRDTGSQVYAQARDPEGRLGWMPAWPDGPVGEAEADAYVARAITRDPDLWVVEVEDPTGRMPFDGPILG